MRTYYALRTSSLEYSLTGHETLAQRSRLAAIPRARVQARKPEDHEVGTAKVYTIRAASVEEARAILAADGWTGRVRFAWEM